MIDKQLMQSSIDDIKTISDIEILRFNALNFLDLIGSQDDMITSLDEVVVSLNDMVDFLTGTLKNVVDVCKINGIDLSKEIDETIKSIDERARFKK